MNLDTRIFNAINGFARDTPWLHPIVSGYANYGTLLFALLMLAAWWTARQAGDLHRMTAAVWTPLGVLAALAINQPIADAVAEVRPCNALHDIVVLHCNTDFGLPSDHAVMAGAATAGLWLVSRRLGLLAALASILMGFARVYVGAHYPQDVLAGYALGAAVGLGGYLVARPVLHRLLAAVARGPLQVLVEGTATASSSKRWPIPGPGCDPFPAGRNPGSQFAEHCERRSPREADGGSRHRADGQDGHGAGGSEIDPRHRQCRRWRVEDTGEDADQHP